MPEQPWHRAAVGGLWEEIGRLQLDFLLARGLRPDHRLLDIGCGSLRGGRRFIDYLYADNYVGIDRDGDLLEAGRTLELEPRVLDEKRPLLVEMDDFAFRRLGRSFDCALAQSLFTHLPLNSIVRCLVEVAGVLEPAGRLYATFFESPGGRPGLEPIVQSVPEPITTFCDRDPFHYDLELLACASAGTGLALEYVGDWGHPRNQKMLCFRPQ